MAPSAARTQASGGPSLGGPVRPNPMARATFLVRKIPHAALHPGLPSVTQPSVLSDPAALFSCPTSQMESLGFCPPPAPACLEAEPGGCGLGDVEAPLYPVASGERDGQMVSTERALLSRARVGRREGRPGHHTAPLISHVVIPEPVLFRTTPQPLRVPRGPPPADL